MINPYNVLGLAQRSDYNTVRKKYIELAKKYHPDNSEGFVSIIIDQHQQLIAIFSTNLYHPTELGSSRPVTK